MQPNGCNRLNAKTLECSIENRHFFTSRVQHSRRLKVWAAVIAIANVTTIDPRSSRVQARQTVIVEGVHIRSIGPASVSPPPGAQVVDGSGSFLIPGLWDTHVHVTKVGKLALPLFVANGVTGVRDMASDFSDIKNWRSAIRDGGLVGPTIKSSGEILESGANVERMKREGTIEPVDRIRIGVSNPNTARTAVTLLAGRRGPHQDANNARSWNLPGCGGRG
ncbi:MAG: hypothetical protein ACJ746_15235 [Bryobacteraceae bacterium]